MLLQHPVPVTLLFPLRVGIPVEKESNNYEVYWFSLWLFAWASPKVKNRYKACIGIVQKFCRSTPSYVSLLLKSWCPERFPPGNVWVQLSGSKGYMPTWLSIYEAHSPVSPQFILTAYKAGCILQIRWLCSWETVICPRSRRPSLWLSCPDLSLPCLMVNSEDLSADPAHLIRGLPGSPVGLSGEWSWRWSCSMLLPWRGPLWKHTVEITQCDGKEPEGFLKVVLTLGPWTFSSAQPSGSFLIFNLCPSPWNLLIWIFAQAIFPAGWDHAISLVPLADFQVVFRCWMAPWPQCSPLRVGPTWGGMRL